MKSRMFIGSSVEKLRLAYAIQENLEHDVESTVWTQGVFSPGRTTMESLIDQLTKHDFALFIFSPDDVTQIRENSKQTVRDNVIFELGMFIGRLGRERCFIVAPRGNEELHIPTDLLGVTSAMFDPNRSDGNDKAALGPACNKVREVISKLGRLDPIVEDIPEQPRLSLISSQEDCLALIQSWIQGRTNAENLKAIRFSAVDIELGLYPGSASRYLEQSAYRCGYIVSHRGNEVILLGLQF